MIMPAEWAPHERTLMAWPRRREIWGPLMADANRETAGVANAIAAFEPLTMVAGSPDDAREARAALTGDVEVVELPIDDSWLRDSGPIFVVDDPERPTRRAGVHWGFNAWGGKFPPWDNDQAIGGALVERLGDEVLRGPMVLEGGAIAVDGAGRLLTTEQCLLHPNRNPDLSREQIEANLRELLGLEQVIWLGAGLAEDRDTDGHVDLIADFTAPGRVLLQSAEPGSPNHEPMAANRERALAAGLEVDDFPLLVYARVNGEEVAASYLNFYVGNGFVVVPTSGDADMDAEALGLIGEALPGREVVGTPGLTLAYGGGGPHCITQQVPSVEPRG